MSNLKQNRKVHYIHKLLSSAKHSHTDNLNKLPEEAKYLLDTWIPNANVKQLNTFMLKKYTNVIRNCPVIENTLKKVIKDRLVSLPKHLQQVQREKLMNYIKQNYPDYYFQDDGKDDGKDIYILKKEGYQKIKTTCNFAGIHIKIIQSSISIIQSIGSRDKDYILFQYNDDEWTDTKYFASTSYLMNEKLEFFNGNFVREVWKILEVFNEFESNLIQIQSQNL